MQFSVMEKQMVSVAPSPGASTPSTLGAQAPAGRVSLLHLEEEDGRRAAEPPTSLPPVTQPSVRWSHTQSPPVLPWPLPPVFLFQSHPPPCLSVSPSIVYPSSSVQVFLSLPICLPYHHPAIYSVTKYSCEYNKVSMGNKKEGFENQFQRVNHSPPLRTKLHSSKEVRRKLFFLRALKNSLTQLEQD